MTIAVEAKVALALLSGMAWVGAVIMIVRGEIRASLICVAVALLTDTAGRIWSRLDLRTTALFGLWSLMPYAIYLLVVYWLSGRFPLGTTLIAAMVAWTAAAAALVFVWSRAS